MTGAQEAIDRIINRAARTRRCCSADPRYLACFPSTRSEIVVPIGHEGTVVGEIDIDSDRPAAFGDDDREFLERIAVQISRAAAGAGAVL